MLLLAEWEGALIGLLAWDRNSKEVESFFALESDCSGRAEMKAQSDFRAS